MRRAYLIEADLRGANLTGVDLRGANWNDESTPGQFQVVNRQGLPPGQPTWDQQLGFPPAVNWAIV